MSNKPNVTGHALMSIAFTLHLVAAAIWVGGMFFAYTSLRPVAAQLLEPPVRLQLWREVFKKFFFWVWTIIVILPVSGYWMIKFQFQGMANVGISIHIMQLTGWLMIAIFLFVYIKPYKQLINSLNQKLIPEAAKQLARIRQLIALNLALGIMTLIIASTHRF